MTKLYFMCGLPCSGKSYYASRLAKKENAIIHSSDDLREELFGDVGEQSRNQELFTELHKRIKSDLLNSKNVIYDSTGLSTKNRQAFLRELTHIPCEKICILMATPYQECLKRNKHRQRQVPESIIKRMYTSFNIPHKGEGFDKVEIINPFQNTFGTPEHFIAKYKYYNQDNSHHKLTLGNHCQGVWRYLKMKLGVQTKELLVAGQLHDCGKPFVKANHNGKGELTTDYHYYNHHFVGAYDSLFYNIGQADHILVALLIQYHMHPYMSWKDSERAFERDWELLGENFMGLISALHESDLEAH